MLKREGVILLLSSTDRPFYPGLTYISDDSHRERIHPLVKLVMLLGFGLSSFALSSTRGQIFLFALLLVSYLRSGLGGALFLRRLRSILIFGFLIFLIQALALKEGIRLWYVSLGPLHLSVWSGGLDNGLTTMLGFINIIGSSFVFVAATDPNRLAYALMQIGLPYRFGFALITSLRFIPIFQLELQQVRNAQQAKGIDLEGLSPKQLLHAVRYLLLPLVISALSRVDSLTISMEGRAFGLYSTRTYLTAQALTRTDKIAILLVPLFFLGTYYFFRFSSVAVMW